MNRVLLGAIVLLFSHQVFSGENIFSVGGGLNFNTFQQEEKLESGVDKEISVNFALAARGEFEVKDAWSFRTGVWLQEKSAKYSVDTSSIDGSVRINTIYASVPLTAQYKASDWVKFFGGYVADFRINDYCTPSGDFTECSLEGKSESIVHLATLGANIYGNHLFDVEVSWQHGLSDYYDDSIKLHTLQIMGFLKF